MTNDTKLHLRPLQEEYVLNENQQSILKGFKEELEHRIGMSVSFNIYKQNLLAYPSINPDMIYFELRVGNLKMNECIYEIEMDSVVGSSFYYFCRRIVDNTMAELTRIGASRA
jgi:hypothetical protein